MKADKNKLFLQTVLLGAMSAALYFLFFIFADRILERSRGFALDGWFFLVPIIIALVFSIIHGVFTSYFWDLLGVRAKRPIIDK